MPSTRIKRRKPAPRKNTRSSAVQRRMTLKNSADVGLVPDISAAIIASHGNWDAQYQDCQLLFDRSRRPDDVGSIRLVGVAIDGERSGIVYVLAPSKNVDKRTATMWRKRVEKWSASREWVVSKLDDGAIELRKRLTPATYKALRKRYMPDDHAEVPRTFGAPIVPSAPITADVAKLITQRVAKRIAGSVPLGVTLRLIDALPGWSWHADTLARPMKGNLLERFERKVLNKGKGGNGSYRVEGIAPVEIHQYRDSLSRANVDEILQHVAETGYAAADFEHTDLPDGVYFTERLVLAPSRRWRIETPPTVAVLPRLQRAEAAVIVTAPSGDTFPLFRSDAGHVGDPETSVIEAPAFWKWAYGQGLADTAEAMLENIDEITMREATSKSGMKDLSNTGECQFCVNTQKLEPGPSLDGSHGRWTHTMVHHGFDYPESQGWRGGTLGQRRGSCPGVGWRPYELAHDRLDKMLPGALESVQNAKALILSRKRQKSEARKPITVTTTDRHSRVEKEETFLPPTYEWERAMERAINDAENQLRAAESFLKWLTHRIDNWKLKPLYDELKAQRDAKRNGRR